MDASTWWWVAAGLTVAAELATGTFYLLMIAVGLIGGALAGHLGGGFTAQMMTAAVVGGGAVAGWHLMRGRQAAPPPPAANPDVNIDIGQRVHVPRWNDDGTARISYRGAQWSARFGGQGLPAPGDHVIRAVDGSDLVLDRPTA
jgi:membrane protein implicated in regulation of membrane protease activity